MQFAISRKHTKQREDFSELAVEAPVLFASRSGEFAGRRDRRLLGIFVVERRHGDGNGRTDPGDGDAELEPALRRGLILAMCIATMMAMTLLTAAPTLLPPRTVLRSSPRLHWVAIIYKNLHKITGCLNKPFKLRISTHG